MNEEEVKVRVVLPWLDRLGIDRTEIQLERTFSVRIGRSTVPVGAPSGENAQKRGRLDLLVKRGEQNLFIVEVKGEGIPLEDADRDQAISYARLVHPIAPFAVVTNGIEWRIYDAVTKQNVEAREIQKGSDFTVSLSDEDRAAAAEFFLGYSIENLLSFCRVQVDTSLGPLRGKPGDPSRRYLPDCHVEREEFRNVVTDFLGGASPMLAVVADSGHGKTSSACYLAERLLDHGLPVLYFRGLMLEGALLAGLQEEFGWTFSEQLNPIALVRRIQRCVATRSLLIVLDGIDEWSYEQAPQHLANTIRHLDGGPIRVLATSGPAGWQRFVELRGQPTGLEKHLHRCAVAGSNTKSAVFQLGAMPDREFFTAVERYRSAFRVSGGFEREAFEMARESGLMLRLLFEVASAAGHSNLTLDGFDLFGRYLDIVAKKTGRPQLAKEALFALARLWLESDTGKIPEASIRVEVGLDTGRTIIADLVATGALDRIDTVDGPMISFTFPAFGLALANMQELDETKFEVDELLTRAKRWLSAPQGSELLKTCYRRASERVRRALDEPLYSNARAFLDAYVRLVSRDFPSLRGIVFAPDDWDRVAFVGEIDLARRLIRYVGFSDRPNNQEAVTLLPISAQDRDSNLIWLQGVDRFTAFGGVDWAASDFDPETAVMTTLVMRPLQDAIRDMKLCEVETPLIFHDTLRSAILDNRNLLSDLLRDGRIMYPLKLSTVRAAVLRARLRHHFEHVLVRQKVESGEIVETWNGTTRGLSYQLAEPDRAWIEAQTAESVASGRMPEWGAVLVNLRDIENLLDRGPGGEHVYPEPPDYVRLFDGSGPDPEIKEILATLASFWDAVHREYQSLVETNFPTWKEQFEGYAAGADQVLMVVNEPPDRTHDLTVDVLSCDAPEGCTDIPAEAYLGSDVDFDRDSFEITVGGSTHRIRSWSNTGVRSLLVDWSYGPLRSHVYRTLKREFDAIARSLDGSDIVIGTRPGT